MQTQDSLKRAEEYLFRQAGLPVELAGPHPWLAGLLGAYAFLEESLVRDIAVAGRIPACGPGCAACCRELIPVTPPEIMGLFLWLRHHPEISLPKPEEEGKPLMACPLLLNEGCRAYPVRPIACRRFVVFETPCVNGEQPLRTRPGDVLKPSRHALAHALRLTLPWYGKDGPAPHEADMAFFAGRSVLLHTLNIFSPR